MNILERVLSRWMYGAPDFSIKKGDVVRSKYWSTDVTVVDVNWALRAAAVELAPGSIVVWPVGNLTRV